MPLGYGQQEGQEGLRELSKIINADPRLSAGRAGESINIFTGNHEQIGGPASRIKASLYGHG